MPTEGKIDEKTFNFDKHEKKGIDRLIINIGAMIVYYLLFSNLIVIIIVIFLI